MRKKRETACREGETGIIPMPDELPMVSVIVLSYNRFEYIYATLQTIIEQEYPKIEVLISDDASDCFPQEALRRWFDTQSVGTNITLRLMQNSTNLGIVKNSMTAVRYARGEVIKFLPPGDGFWGKDALTRLVHLLLTSKQNVAASPAYIYKGKDVTSKRTYPTEKEVRLLQTCAAAVLFDRIAARNMICAVGTVFRKDFFVVHGLDESYRNLDDWPNWLRLYRLGLTIPFLEKPAVYYRMDGISVQHGGAYRSPLLRTDMQRCLQQEILPYAQQLSPFTRWITEYRLFILENDAEKHMPIRLWPLDVLFRIKRRLQIWRANRG